MGTGPRTEWWYQSLEQSWTAEHSDKTSWVSGSAPRGLKQTELLVQNLSVLEFSGSCLLPSKSTATPANTWLHGMVFAPDLKHAEGKEYCIHFFLKIMGKIRTQLTENWDPHQVSMQEIMSETKDKC